MYDVSIIIVSYNIKDLLNRCLESVFAASIGFQNEVVVVENASQDGSKEFLKEKWHQIKVLYNDENNGYSPACNQGLRASTGRYKLLLNPDAFLIKDGLKKMVDFMDNNMDVCAVGPRVLNSDGSIQRQCARKEPTFISNLLYFSGIFNFIPLDRCWNYLNRFESNEFYHSINDVQVLSGACMLIRSKAIESIGLLNEQLILAGDDVEWSIRARKHGYRLVFFPEAEVVHIGGQSRKFTAGLSQEKTVESLLRYIEMSYRYPLSSCLKLAVLNNILLSIFTQTILFLLFPNKNRRRAQLKTQVKLLVTAFRSAFHTKT